MDNDMESYLRQYQSQMYQVHPLILNPFQSQHQIESNLTTISYPMTMFNINNQQLNRNYRSQSDKQQTNQSQLTTEQLKEKLRKQLEYYFSKENMINDVYLQSQMDADNYVPISLIANFKLIKRLTNDLQLIIDVLKESARVEVDIEEKKVRPLDLNLCHPARKRCIIILRNVPLDATDNEILNIFSHENCSISAIECERVLESDHMDCWYVTFNSEDDAQTAFLYLTKENISIRGQKLLARMKTRLWEKPLNQPNDNNSSDQNTSNFIQSPPRNSSTNFPYLTQEQATINYRHTPHIPINITTHQNNLRGTLSFNPTTNIQPINMNIHQQAQFINRYRPFLPTNFWYIPSTTDPYGTMLISLRTPIRAYNVNSKSKNRMPTLKLRNSAKTNSKHEGNKVSGTQSNNPCETNSAHSEDSNSIVLRNETIEISQTSTETTDRLSNE